MASSQSAIAACPSGGSVSASANASFRRPSRTAASTRERTASGSDPSLGVTDRAPSCRCKKLRQARLQCRRYASGCQCGARSLRNGVFLQLRPVGQRPLAAAAREQFCRNLDAGLRQDHAKCRIKRRTASQPPRQSAWPRRGRGPRLAAASLDSSTSRASVEQGGPALPAVRGCRVLQCGLKAAS